MMRAVVERMTGRKPSGLLDAVVATIAMRIVDALASRLEPVVAAAVERCLAHPARLASTPFRWKESAGGDTVGAVASSSVGSDTERRPAPLEGQELRPVGTSDPPSTLRSTGNAAQRTS